MNGQRRVGDLFNAFGMVPGDDDDGFGDSGARWLGREVHQVCSGPCEIGFTLLFQTMDSFDWQIIAHTGDTLISHGEDSPKLA
jgi:hypothetical protein